MDFNNLLFGSVMEGGITGTGFLASTACSLLLGWFMAWMYMRKNHYTKSFILSLVLLPAIVQMVIMLVNGNVGAGVAVMGAFSLVRFRSAPGTSQEITAIFLAMAVGLATGMGYLGVAIISAVVISAANLLLVALKFGEGRVNGERTLKITVPENLDYEGVFDGIFSEYTTAATLEEVRTSGMGALYLLMYRVRMRPDVSVKKMLDELRARNGNLEISIGRVLTAGGEHEL